MQNLYAAIVSMPSDRDGRPVDNFEHLTIEYGGYSWAVEVPKGNPGNMMMKWIGGYFETFWSVNPPWTAEFKTIGKHPVANGVKPFTLKDEWYYHMRFREDMKGVPPLLSARPPPARARAARRPHSALLPHPPRRPPPPPAPAWLLRR